MAIDFVPEGIVSAALRVLVAIARLLLFIAFDIGYHQVCWFVGWCACRLVTFGRWPTIGVDGDAPTTEFWVSFIGLVIILVTIVVGSGLLNEAI